MTDAQELILDGLMAAETIGEQRPSGLLGVAVQALTGRRLPEGGGTPRVLGFPAILCEALHGAGAALGTVDERRKLAVSFFSAVVPRPGRRRLSPRRHVELALECACRAHALLCLVDCPFAAHVARQVHGCLAGKLPAEFTETSTPPVCPVAHARESSDDNWCQSPEHSSFWALNHARAASACVALCGLALSTELSVAVGQKAARVAARVGGVPGALEFCLALAKALRLEP